MDKPIEFKPCFTQLNRLDQLLIIEKECSYSEDRAPGSNIGILRENHGNNAIVGVVIYGYSQWQH